MIEHFGLSLRRVSELADVSRSALAYVSRLDEAADKLRTRMKELADKRHRFGCPRIHIVLKREGLVVNHKRTERIYREEKLSLRVRKKKKRASNIRLMLPEATRPNERWSMDFVQDKLWNGRRFRALTIVDVFSKSCPWIEVDTSIGGDRVARVLDQVAEERGLPESITIDNGPEFAGKALDAWAYRNKVQLNFIRPGKPVENAYIESFNGRFRDECLNEHYFLDLEEARETIEEWRLDYHSFRPHSSLGGLTPEEFINQYTERVNLQPA